MKNLKKIKEKNDEIIDLLANYNQNRLYNQKNNRLTSNFTKIILSNISANNKLLKPPNKLLRV